MSGMIEGETLAPAAAALIEARAIDRRSLRRVDWRVLLPVPPNGFDHLVVLGGPDGLGGVMTQIGLARQVSTDMPEGPVADAVAILRGAHVGCEEVARALLPGGCLYWELEAPHGWATGFRRSVGKRLRRSRLSLTGCYWVMPDFERGEVFVPIVREALEWYLRHWIGESSLRASLISSLAPLAARGGAVSRSSRACGVTAIAGPASNAGPSILEHPALSERSRKDRLYPLVMNREQTDATSRVIVFPFCPGNAHPAAVLKFWRLPRRNADTLGDQKIIAELRSRLDPTLRESIPAPLGVSRWGQVVVGAEACVPGKPLSRDKTRQERRRISDLVLVTQWLGEFHRQTGCPPGPFSAAQLQSVVEGPLTAYSRTFGNTVEEERLFERARERAASLLGRPFPLVWSHPAFSEWNIYRRGRQISVIDWEGAEVGPPLRDLIYFVALWYYRSRPGRGAQAELDSFGDVLFPSAGDRLAAAASGALEDHMARLSLDPRFYPLMLVVTWVTHAAGRWKRVRNVQGDLAEPRRGNLHVSRVRILAENHSRLFPEGKS
jgi:hypothetical protein